MTGGSSTGELFMPENKSVVTNFNNTQTNSDVRLSVLHDKTSGVKKKKKKSNCTSSPDETTTMYQQTTLMQLSNPGSRMVSSKRGKK